MDVWRRSLPGTDPRRARAEGPTAGGQKAEGRVAIGQSSSQTTRDTPPRASSLARGVAFSGEVKWLDVGTSGFSAIAADTHIGVCGTAADYYRTCHGSTGTTSESSSARPCATAAVAVCIARTGSIRWKRRSTTSIR